MILGLLLFAGCALAAFLRIEARAASPVVSLALFKVRAFSVGVSSLALNFAGQSAVTFLLPFYLQEVKDFSTAQTGLVMATVPSMMLLLSPVSGRISDRYGFRHQTTFGIALVSVGLLLMATIDGGTPVPLLVARLALIGIGTSIFMSPNSSAIMGSVSRDRLGTASAAVGTARNIGNATGLAMASAILVAVATASAGFSASRLADLPEGALVDGIRMAFLVAAIASSTAIVASSFRGRAARVVAVAGTGVAPAAGQD